ncbi:restriction endonuclease subunit S [Marinobacter sp. RI1]|uniref:restriction endonuclease subunit S n=1 Tax=Marinobacter sp. RI1 TaxID=3158171 RepID=UPI0034E88080
MSFDSASNWTLRPLGECIDLIIDHRGKTPRKLGSNWVDSGVPTISAKNVSGGKLVAKESIRFVSHDIYKKWMKEDVRKGDCLLVSEGATLGECLYWDEDYPVVLGQRIFCIRANPEILNPRYLYAYMTSEAFQQEIRSRATGSSVPGLRQTEVLKLMVLAPPLDEQAIIGNTLFSVNEKIKSNTKTNRTLEQMAQAIFKSWFVDFEPVKAKIAALEAGGSEEDALLAAMQAISGKGEAELTRLQAEQPEQYAELRATAELFPSTMRDSELGEIPEGWEPAPLSELFELHRGFDLPQKSREEGPYEVYAAGGLHGTHSQYKMEPPGIITGRSGVIGNVYLSLKKYWPLNTTLYVRQFRSCGPYYAYHLLKTLDLKTLNSGSAVPSLNRNFVHSISVINPGSTVLNKFESLSSSLFEQVVQNIDQNELLSTLRDTLLPKLLSGELSVSTAEDQLAEAAEPANV